MKCPIDGSDLVITDRSGVEIDFCPKCRGVWLDRGELDKIIERSAQYAAAPPRPEPVREERGGYREDDRGHREDGYDRKKKRRGFLDDLFDFD